ncbi:sensor histidine kinase [Bradyrhizobium sp. WBOS7]|uniref:histidine kinase n=2 Tax=Nitrobacteraceae TaxID=41294 RepID=A0AAE9SRR9_9BRAD|nr:sensor histidine kinase [Bradyrhizobium sp. WBOS2]MDD1569252.1 sensor histidine kinase [Bradyrhizobium sp. WBOS1]MDD1576371.1 sensor histidine kinase [Bradyrhizobium sp. WBOS7]MDD1603812.1 sensor histidine kinase [Bradyrhizobium sp. WBOS16]UUO38051.1 sensor histidine kinase [Bradyrhizobium sp. WBOS01]UUO44217.1 sensor histidine kinase [Bradyrhizobium sp. WBOS02]UUO54624.1 sensor histidine kinase [Bradyrhizobium sp. WBOS07]UUO68625.1 sensor histidine kinase [Bradyrhizobium betae]
MRSIARTFSLSLGIAATTIFLTMLGIFISRYPTEEHEFRSCQVVAAVLDRATVIEGHGLTVRSTPALEELKADSPNLWYVVSAGELVSEYGSEHRPALPFVFPYRGPVGTSVFSTLDQNSTFCLSAVQRGSVRLGMMVGEPRVRFGRIARTFLLRRIFSIFLVALAFAATVAVGSALAARYVSRSIERVARRALAIDPSAPQGLISLSEVPSELKPLVEALNRAFGEIDAYIRMQRRFLGNAAHQLRTPLTLLRAKIEDLPDPALKAELVRDVRRLTSLVSAMLDLARLQNHAIETRPIDLGEIARDVLADFGPSALDANIELALEQAGPDPVMVQGVDAAVRSALANLVGNALIHARGARRITATLGRDGISIHDDGAGLPDGVAQGLTEPFQTGTTAGDGAGLGLSIVREIMAAHGGELVISSAPGRGTTMSLRFPVTAAPTRSPHLELQTG